MPSRICRACGVKKANRPGTLCYPCWVAAGKPTAEEAAAKAARDFELAETAKLNETMKRVLEPASSVEWDAPESGVKPDAPVLSTESEGELSAMRWVTTHAPGDERTWEQRSARQFKEASPAAFYKRKADLEEAEGAFRPDSLPKNEWNGIGPCPCCGHEKEKPLDDPGTSKILALLAELDEREAVNA